MTQKTAGVLSVLTASIMWAIEPVFAKLAYRTTDLFNIFVLRIMFSLAIITLYLILTNRRYFIISKKHMPWLVYNSLVATLFADLVYIYVLSKIAVINAVLIGHMQPIFIILMGFVFLKTEVLTKFDYFGILFMIIAGLLVTTRTIQNLASFRLGAIGDLYMLFATIAWASTSIVTRKYLKELPGSTLAFYRFFFTGVVVIIFAVFSKGIKVPNLYPVFMGIIIGIGTILYYEGLRRIKAVQVAALELSTPFYATVIAFFILHEYITLMQAIGIFSLFAGIYFLSKKENDSQV